MYNTLIQMPEFYKAGIYIRLSRDDNYSDSNSIDNQIK